MPNVSGKPKKQISYKVPLDLRGKIDSLIVAEEFSSLSDVVTAALRSFFNEKAFEERMDERIRKYLSSDEGKELIRSVLIEKND
jgi:Arc/MetJ-type ribon-helix-helix transcriptional regulator